MFPNRKFPLFRFSTSYRFFSNSSCRTQRTLKKSIYFSGISLHNGKQVNLSIHPSTHVNNSTGILFQTPNGMIPASYENVSSTNFCTTLCGFKTSNEAGSLSNIYFVHTVEHLLAAFYICNIQNAIVEIDGEELPILDGSSQPYCDAFEGNAANPLSTDSCLVEPPTIHSTVLSKPFKSFLIADSSQGWPITPIHWIASAARAASKVQDKTGLPHKFKSNLL